MRDIRETLRQKFLLGRNHRQIAESLTIGAGAVGRPCGGRGPRG
jgi:hypothetical protein